MTSMTFDQPPEPRLRSKRDSAEYQRIHKWVYATLGEADRCSENAEHKSGRYHWANVSRQYKMEASDWMKLCPKCHHKLDGVHESLRELKRQQSRGNTSHNTPVIATDIERQISYAFASVKEAAQTVGRTHSAISNALKGRVEKSARLSWKYRSAL